MASSLEKLVDAIDKSDFKITMREFGNKTDTILLKSVYPMNTPTVKKTSKKQEYHP